jgi:hypothetical protein
MAKGNDVPELTISYSGFVNNDSSSDLYEEPTASTEASSSSTLGTYDITVSGGSDDNYSYTYVKGTLTITVTNDISDQSAESISVYPNPATTTINVEGSTGVVYLYNLAGNMVLTQDLSQDNSINVSGLTHGIYLLKVDGKIIKVVKK